MRFVDREGKRSGRRGKVVRMNVAMRRSNDHRIWAVGLFYTVSLEYEV